VLFAEPSHDALPSCGARGRDKSGGPDLNQS
jgi:hypothetical protein